MKGVMVNVFCDDTTHPTKRAMLETFTKTDTQTQWVLMPVKRRSGDGYSRWSKSALDERDQLVDTGPEGPITDPRGWTLRYRYEIECPICDRSLQVRSENIEPILDVLADHADFSRNANGDEIGVFAISLRALAARDTSK